MIQGDTPRYRVLATSIALGLAFTSAQAQIPGDAPGGSPQYRDANGVLQPGSGAAGTTNMPSGTWTPASPGSSSGMDRPASDMSSGTTVQSPSSSPASDVPSTPPRGAAAPGGNPSPSNDGAWDVNGARSNQPSERGDSSRSSINDELPSEPTAAGPSSSGAYGGYDPARQSWIPYTSSGYIGVSGGKPDLNTACVAGQSCDDPDSAWSIFLGGQFNPYLGLQLGYLQLQDADRNGGDTKVRGVNIVLTGALPLGSNFSLNGRLGGTYGWTKTSVGTGVAAPSGNEEGFGLSYGVGASWDFDRHWSVTVDWDRHRLKYAGDDKKDTDIASVGLRYRF